MDFAPGDQLLLLHLALRIYFWKRDDQVQIQGGLLDHDFRLDAPVDPGKKEMEEELMPLVADVYLPLADELIEHCSNMSFVSLGDVRRRVRLLWATALSLLRIFLGLEEWARRHNNDPLEVEELGRIIDKLLDLLETLPNPEDWERGLPGAGQ